MFRGGVKMSSDLSKALKKHSAKVNQDKAYQEARTVFQQRYTATFDESDFSRDDLLQKLQEMASESTYPDFNCLPDLNETVKKIFEDMEATAENNYVENCKQPPKFDKLSFNNAVKDIVPFINTVSKRDISQTLFYSHLMGAYKDWHASGTGGWGLYTGD